MPKGTWMQWLIDSLNFYWITGAANRLYITAFHWVTGVILNRPVASLHFWLVSVVFCTLPRCGLIEKNSFIQKLANVSDHLWISSRKLFNLSVRLIIWFSFNTWWLKVESFRRILPKTFLELFQLTCFFKCGHTCLFYLSTPCFN